MLQELERVGYSWERAKALANNRVRWGKLEDVLCSHGGDKEQ